MEISCVVEGVIAGLITVLIVEAIRWLLGGRIKPDKVSRARQKLGSITGKIVGHNFVDQMINYPEIRGAHLYSECESCGKKKDEETIPYEELARRHKSKSP
jgi:hypothetical protein